MSIVDMLRERSDDVARRYLGGESAMSIAKDFRCGGASVYLFLRDEKGIKMRKPKDIADYQDLIREVMDNGGTAQDIIKKTDLPATTCRRYIKKLGYDISYRKAGSHKLDKQTKEIIRLYTEEKMGCTKISKIIGCTEASVTALLRRHGHDGSQYMKVYDVDHAFLDKVDTEEKAWFIGYFMGDGCNRDNGFDIVSVDLDVVQKVKRMFNFDGDFYTKEPPKDKQHRKVQYRIRIGSKQICQRLTEMDCPINKTFLTKLDGVLKNIPENLMRHFFRGLLESDGSIYKNSGPNRTRVIFSGTKQLMNDCNDYLCKNVGIRGKIYTQQESGTHILRYNSFNDVYRLLRYMYDNSTIFMDRKHKLAMNFIENLDGRPDLLNQDYCK